MGLDTTHGCWSGAYSAFARWCNELATVAGYEMGSPDEHGIAAPKIGWDRITLDNLAGHWDDIPCRLDGTPDPLLILIAHYDCEGWILSRFCDPLADRLAELVPLLPIDPDHGHIGHWRAKTERFICGLREAAKAGEDVEFT